MSLSLAEGTDPSIRASNVDVSQVVVVVEEASGLADEREWSVKGMALDFVPGSLGNCKLPVGKGRLEKH